MQTTVENLGQLERRVNVAVPIASIEGEVAKRLSKIARSAKVAGFRPGHVPTKMIAQQYGPQVRSEVISEAVQKGFDDAVREQKLRVAGYPRIEPRQGGEGAADALEFSAVFEVYPEVSIGDFGGLTIERPTATVTPADVDRTVETLRRQRATWTPANRPAAADDRVTVDFTGTIDGVEFAGGQAQDFVIQLGEGRMLPEFEAAVTGMQAGEQKSFPLVFPADYHGKDVAGKAAEFALTVKDVSVPVLPALDAEFAKTFGIPSGSLDELRREIEGNLGLELKRKVESVLRDQVFSALRKQAPANLPRALVDAEAQGIMQRTAADLAQRGLKPEDMKISPDIFKAQAEERVALGLVVGELVRRENLQAKPADVRALVAESAQTYEQPDAVVRWHYEQPERLREFEGMALERNVVNWVMERAKLVDRPVDFQALMGPARG